LSATRNVTAGDYSIRVETDAGPKASASFTLTIPELPAGCKPLSEQVITDRNNRKFYERIAFVPPDGPEIEFVLVPRLREETSGPETFYIMKDKVAVRDFRPYVRRHGVDWQTRLGEEYPALRVPVPDAYRFATKWILGGKLPTTDQWDKAAGRWVKGQQGPFEGKWGKALEGKIAVGRTEPMKVGEAEKDVSPYQCRDMSGNGQEWTRTTTLGELNEDRLGSTASVKLRSRLYTDEKPFQFADLERGFEPSLPVSPKLPKDDEIGTQIGFRVVIEP